MKLLAIDTSTEACSAALLIDNNLFEHFELTPKAHTRLLLPMIEDLFMQSGVELLDLNALSFGCGPGSFTGVRIATGVIQGLAFGANLPVVPISTLGAMAHDFFEQHVTENVAFVAADARIGEIFWAVYQRNADNFAELVNQERVIAPNLIDFPKNKTGFGIGSGWKVYPAELRDQLQSLLLGYSADYLPKASVIARLAAYQFKKGLCVDAENAQPVYLRDKVAKTQAERESQIS